ncbi:conserved hypothetical protein [Ricinus communis]|uniref:Uncharacterized protein n=1 Tax=Ricinus communis TaxID=3988 RepID=B9S159_RICCO|nr:conserved hypothetical protein [Ricinus communis]
MDKKEDDKDDQESKSDHSSSQDNEVDLFEGLILIALDELEQQRLQRAKKKPHLEARFQALKDRPVQFYTLSDEEKKRIFYRQKERIESLIFPDCLIPPIFFRPPKHPIPPIDLLPPKQSTLPPKKRKIPEVNGANNSNKGITIANESSTSTSKRPKSSEQEEIWNGYSRSIDNPAYSAIKKLFEMIKRFTKGKEIRSLEGKIYTLLHEGEENIFKNHDKESREPKRSFYEWVKDCYYVARFNAIKIRAVNPAMAISHAILDIMFLMSENKPTEMGAKFQAFEDTLAWVDRGENTVVISRIVDLIRAADIQLRLKNRLEMRSFRGKGVMIPDVKQSNLHDDLEESFIDRIMYELLEEIFRLELFWVYKRLPYSMRELVYEFTSLETEVSRFEVSLMALEEEIQELVEDANFGVVDMDWRESDGYIEMDIKLDEQWHELQE